MSAGASSTPGPVSGILAERRGRDGHRPAPSPSTDIPGASVPETTPSSSRPRTHVLDTSVLLADPGSLGRFDEHEVVLPVVVLTELEAKRNHPELGWAAREALRVLERLRIEHGTLTAGLPVNPAGGTLRVELNHQDTRGLPAALTTDNNDHRILAVAHNLAAEGADVVVVTKDLPLRLKASIVGLDADEYRNEQSRDTGWSGFAELDVATADIDELFEERTVDLAAARDLPCHAGVALHNGSQSALGRVHPDKRIHLVTGERSLFDVRGRSAEQRVAIDILADPEVGIVSLGGRAGTGKSVLALAAGLDAVVEKGTHSRVMVFRPLYAVGGQDLGFLPGDRDEKIGPWGAAVLDALHALAGREVVEEVLARDLLEVLPLTHIRGRSLTDAFVVIDEAQNLERGVLLTALSRLGEGSRVVLTHDVGQRDNLRVGRHDGITSVIEALTGHPLFAHLTLARAERSAVAALVTRVLEGTPD
ncbi:MAG: PhoH family protein [Acidimicrobiia bacterium]|nr:PhoH family protein [Acidimicrobiia bacterium]